MTRRRVLLLLVPVVLGACRSGIDHQGTIAQLRSMQIDVREASLDGGVEIAIASYQRFLQEAPDSALAPEAIRRLADLNVEREYGYAIGGAGRSLAAPPRARLPAAAPEGTPAAAPPESEADFARRATADTSAVGAAAAAAASADSAEAGALAALALYRKLLHDHPAYEHNDQVLYQMSRAYEELGRIEEAMEVMDRLVRDFPRSRTFDEVQFRRAEYFFTHRRYREAENAYQGIVDFGARSPFFELALYKLGWTFYKQDLHEEAMHRFTALLDHKVAVGYDFAQTADEQERKRIEDTFRVISLGFSHLGGAEAVADYFAQRGARPYEDGVYSNLGEYYVDKRRYNDAAATYNAFVRGNPFHRAAPRFEMRVIEIYQAGAFPTLVLDGKKAFATHYGLQSEYWRHFDPAEHPEVLGYLKTNLTDLANHYHALYQEPKQAAAKPAHFAEALHWYREFLASFPAAPEAPATNYQLADLLLEHGSFVEAAAEYEKTAYDYPHHEKSATAGYAAVYARRQHLGRAGEEAARRDMVRSSLRFAETFPEHEKAAVVLGGAAEELYALKDYAPAVVAAQQLIETFPAAGAEVLRAAWLVVAHASYELLHYAAAEGAYATVLAQLPDGDATRAALVDNLAAAIYKQGEEANGRADYAAAAEHFLRVGRLAPASKIRPTAEYDAAAALMQRKDWKAAATVLLGFRAAFPDHNLQLEVTKKLAWVYREDGQLDRAAAEFERIERETADAAVRREALLTAAELHLQAGNRAQALGVYRRYVGAFPQPVELNVETRSKIAGLLQTADDRAGYLQELAGIVAADAAAGGERTPRTRYLAAQAALVLAERHYERFAEVRLEQPFEASLRRKRELLKGATRDFTRLLDYEVGETTAAATFYLAEINAHFSKALTESERPEGLSPAEREEYELAIEEQAYPFEEKAIAIHESNLQLLAQGVYNPWIARSLQQLAVFMPARYAKPEAASDIIDSLDSYVFEIVRPTPPAPPAAEEPSPVPAAVTEPVPLAAALPAEPAAAEPAPLPTTEKAAANPAVPARTAVP